MAGLLGSRIPTATPFSSGNRADAHARTDSGRSKRVRRGWPRARRDRSLPPDRRQCAAAHGMPAAGGLAHPIRGAERRGARSKPLCANPGASAAALRRLGHHGPRSRRGGQSGARNRDSRRRPMRCVDVPLTANGADRHQFGGGTLVSVRVRARQGVAVRDLRDRLSWSRDKSRDRTRTGHLRSLVRRPRTAIVP